MPGIPSRFELDGFLKQHEVETYTAEDSEHDLANLDPVGGANTPGA